MDGSPYGGVPKRVCTDKTRQLEGAVSGVRGWAEAGDAAVKAGGSVCSGADFSLVTVTKELSEGVG
jgi:hypothetical protein